MAPRRVGKPTYPPKVVLSVESAVHDRLDVPHGEPSALLGFLQYTSTPWGAGWGGRMWGDAKVAYKAVDRCTDGPDHRVSCAALLHSCSRFSARADPPPQPLPAWHVRWVTGGAPQDPCPAARGPPCAAAAPRAPAAAPLPYSASCGRTGRRCSWPTRRQTGRTPPESIPLRTTARRAACWPGATPRAAPRRRPTGASCGARRPPPRRAGRRGCAAAEAGAGAGLGQRNIFGHLHVASRSNMRGGLACCSRVSTARLAAANRRAASGEGSRSGWHCRATCLQACLIASLSAPLDKPSSDQGSLMSRRKIQTV